MMIKNDIVIVSGLSRCGTTLMMRILDHAGFPVYAPNKVSYEDNRTSHVTKKDLWLAEAQGKAIKILDLQRMSLPKEFTYKIIWMKRDLIQQAKSQVKFLQMVAGIPVQMNEWKKMYQGIIKDDKRAYELLYRNSYPHITVMFENLISNDPYAFPVQMNRVGEFLGVKLDLGKVLNDNIIIKRTPECRDGMDIEAMFLPNKNKLL